MYVFGAVNPVTGASSALIAPTVNTHLMSTHLMSTHLAMIAAQAGEEVRVVRVLDGAGWHVSGGLKVPPSMTLL